MAIHAQRTAFRSSAQFPDFLVTSPIQQNDFLVWCEDKRAFKNITADDVALILGTLPVGPAPAPGTVTGAVNLGAGVQSFVQLNAGNLEFRSIVGSAGISVQQNAQEIYISNDIDVNKELRSNDGIKFVIDDDGTTDCSARFEICTMDNPVDLTLTPVSYSAPTLTLTVVADPLFIQAGQFISTGFDFGAAGFEPGMCLRAVGTDEQDGVWKIASITTTNTLNDTITITVPFTDATDAGLQPATTLEAMFFEFTGLQTIEILGGFDFIQQGFEAGQTIELTGTTDNDGTYTIASVTASTVSINETFPGTLGCDAGTINFTVPEEVISTGFWVDECGNLSANTVNTQAVFSVDGEFTGQIDAHDLFVDNEFTVGGLTIQEIIDGSIPAFPENGLLVQTAPGVFTGAEITVGAGLSVTNGNGILDNPLIELDSFPVSLSGSVTGTGSFTPGTGITITTGLSPNGVIIGSYNRVVVDNAGLVTQGENQPIESTGGIIVANPTGVGGNNPTLTARDVQIKLQGAVNGTAIMSDLSDVTINTQLGFSGVIAGQYNKVTVDNQGRVIAGRNQEIDVGPGLKILNADGVLGDPTILVDDFNITLTGDVQGTGTVTDLQNATIPVQLAPVMVPGTYTSVTVDNKGRVVSGSQAAFPPLVLPTHLQNLNDGMDNPGYVVWTGAAYEERSILGTLNEIEVTSGDGDPSTMIGLANNPIIPGRASITVPRGFAIERPAIPTHGMFRFGLDADAFEGYDGVSWKPILFGAPGDYLPTAGGTMSGDIDMSGNNIITAGLIDGRDVAVDGIALDAINTGTGIKVQTGPNVFENREIEAEPGSGIQVQDGDGQLGNPTIGFNLTTVPELNFGEAPQPDDEILIYDKSTGTMQKVSLKRVVSRQAFRYFMAQV